MARFQGIVGIILILMIAYIFSNNKKRINYRLVMSGLALQLTIGILILKPIVTSITLASGGDGGVFAPSLFIGAFLGLLVASISNTYLSANIIPINFMVIGMAAVLSASINAPLTSIFLVCGLTNNYTLFIPILAVCFISKHTAQLIYPFTVYTYSSSLSK